MTKTPLISSSYLPLCNYNIQGDSGRKTNTSEDEYISKNKNEVHINIGQEMLS